MIKKIVLTSLLFVSLTSSTFAADPTVATVNGVQIKKSYFDQSYQQNRMFLSTKIVTKKKVLNDLVNRELGILKAKKNKLDKDPTVLKKMQDIMFHAQISKDLEPELAKISVTDADVKSYYRTNKEYRTAHILFRVRANPSEAEDKAALEQALKVYRQVQKKNELFAELASKYSQSNTASMGGDMGFQPPVNYAPEYYAAIKGKKIDSIIPPVRTQYGYHIIKVIAVKPFKEIQENSMPIYKKIVYDIKRDAILAKYFKGLQKGATISINKKYLK